MLEQQLPPGVYDYPPEAVSRAVQPVASATVGTDGAFALRSNSPKWDVQSVVTNYVRRSEALDLSPWTGVAARSLAAEEFSTGVSMWLLAKSSTVTSENVGQGIPLSLSVGMALTAVVALLAGTSAKVAVGLYYNSSWGATGESTFEVLSGPGVATRSGGALIQVDGLHATVPTLLRITRTAVAAVAAPTLFVYPGTHLSTTSGDSVKVGRVQVEFGGVPSDYVPSGLNPTARASGFRLRVEPAATNMLKQSQTFSAADWAKTNVTFNSSGVVGPDGTTLAFKLAESGTTAVPHYSGQAFTSAENTSYTFSFFVRASERTAISVEVVDKANTFHYHHINLVNGATSSTVGALSPVVTPLFGGWYRVSITRPSGTGAGVYRYNIFLSNAFGAPAAYAGTVGSGVLIWGAQVELGTVATSYIPTTTAAVTRPADQVFVRAAYPTGATEQLRRVNGAIYMVEAFFTQGTQRWTNWPLDVEWNGDTYRGLGELGSVSEMKESEGGDGGKVTLKLSPVSPGLLPLAMGNVESYRGKPVNIYIWPIDNSFRRVGQPILRHFGVMDQVSIKQDGDSGVIELTCLPGGTNGVRRSGGMRVSAAQQKLLDPTDRGLEYAQALVNNPQLWLSKAFQEV